MNVIGEPQSSFGGILGWRAALKEAGAELRALGRSAARALSEHAFNAFCITRNAAAIATLPAVAAAFPDAVVVWMGAHPCLNTPGTTRTGDLGGMALAGAAGLWDSGHGGGLAPANIILFGARELDPGEKDVVARFPIRNIPIGPRMVEELIETVDGRDVFLHFSCDVLRPGIVPTDYTVEGGLSIDTVLNAARALATKRVVGLQISELEQDPHHSFTDSAHLVVEMLAPLLPRSA